MPSEPAVASRTPVAAPVPVAVSGPKLYTRECLFAKGIRLSNQGMIDLEIRGAFPARRHIGQAPRQHVVWLASEIDAWINDLPPAEHKPITYVRRKRQKKT